jgi:hypothetical protein
LPAGADPVAEVICVECAVLVIGVNGGTSDTGIESGSVELFGQCIGGGNAGIIEEREATTE